ncbi:probable ribosome-binding factor A, chloroplastic [Panicum virgatum]|nr:probable ribosome-binding factor A, chloroplastic [Panicum virgatum]
MLPCRPLAPPPLPRALTFARVPPSLLRPPPLSLRVVRCMAKERRVRMVAKQIQRELADMLTRDPVLQRAVLPEAALGADRYLSSLTTIADVELSNDLQVCKVYVSVFGDERGKKVAIDGLKAKTKYVRSQIGKRMKLRLTPEIRFIEDESMERGSRILAILDKLKEEREQQEGKDGEEDGEGSYISEEEDGNWDADEPDEEDIIYVK